jgi:hypothetical protein
MLPDPNFRQGRRPDRDDEIMVLGGYMLMFILVVSILNLILEILKWPIP